MSLVGMRAARESEVGHFCGGRESCAQMTLKIDYWTTSKLREQLPVVYK